LGHDVLVLTQTEFQAEIEQELAAGTLPANLRFDIFMPVWLERLRDAGLRSGFHSLTWHMVSVLWQICVFFHVQRYYKRAEIDLIHHVSFSGIRYPTLLTLLGLPTVIGPIGGGETAPMALRKSFPWKDWCTEIVRDVHNRALRADPITRSAFRSAKLIVLRTKESLVAVPPRFRSKVYVTVGMGVAEPQEENLLPRAPGPRAPGESLRLMYAARLLYWKGGHLALKALANARARGANATLTVIGDGRARPDFERLAGELGVAAYVTWTGTVSHQELLTIYRGHHVFLFPSLHDAGGTVSRPRSEKDRSGLCGAASSGIHEGPAMGKHRPPQNRRGPAGKASAGPEAPDKSPRAENDVFCGPVRKDASGFSRLALRNLSAGGL